MPVCKLEYPCRNRPVLNEAVLESPEEGTRAERLHAGPEKTPGAIQARWDCTFSIGGGLQLIYERRHLRLLLGTGGGTPAHMNQRLQP